MAVGDVWGNSWLTSWGTSWAQAETPPVPTPTTSGGGGGGRRRQGYQPRFQIIYPNVKRGKTIDKKIGEWIEAIAAGETEEREEVEQVRKAIAPYIKKDTIDLAAMQKDAAQLRTLLKAYEADVQRMDDEEDDELMMMVL